MCSTENWAKANLIVRKVDGVRISLVVGCGGQNGLPERNSEYILHSREDFAHSRSENDTFCLIWRFPENLRPNRA